jgi:hypothetical protein
LLRKRWRKTKIEKDLTQFDEEFKEYCERLEDDPFDRESRLTALKNHRFNPAENSIFSAIFQELKKREKTRKGLSRT